LGTRDSKTLNKQHSSQPTISRTIPLSPHVVIQSKAKDPQLLL
jgi:hypothetical protein